MTENYTDRRKFDRVDTVQPIFIEEIKPGGRSNADKDILRCETVDVSIKGLRIYVPQEIKKGSKLNIAVPDKDFIENLELVGVARWVTKAENKEGYWVGLELQDTSRENMEKWFKTVSMFSGKG